MTEEEAKSLILLYARMSNIDYNALALRAGGENRVDVLESIFLIQPYAVEIKSLFAQLLLNPKCTDPMVIDAILRKGLRWTFYDKQINYPVDSNFLNKVEVIFNYLPWLITDTGNGFRYREWFRKCTDVEIARKAIEIGFSPRFFLYPGFQAPALFEVCFGEEQLDRLSEGDLAYIRDVLWEYLNQHKKNEQIPRVVEEVYQRVKSRSRE
jgi:hypothetical protein